MVMCVRLRSDFLGMKHANDFLESNFFADVERNVFILDDVEGIGTLYSFLGWIFGVNANNLVESA